MAGTPQSVTTTIYSATNSALTAIATTAPTTSVYGFTSAQAVAIITQLNLVIDLLKKNQLPTVTL